MQALLSLYGEPPNVSLQVPNFSLRAIQQESLRASYDRIGSVRIPDGPKVHMRNEDMIFLSSGLKW